MSKYSKDWLRLRKEYPAIESTEPETKNLRDQWLKRKAQAEALRYLAQKEFEKKPKVSKADWIAIVILTWFSITTLYLLITNLVL
tara:strand:+ start:91 stop:345 length:255 start_codon:yes stop_codon:yes gene_type:complete